MRVIGLILTLALDKSWSLRICNAASEVLMVSIIVMLSSMTNHITILPGRIFNGKECLRKISFKWEYNMSLTFVHTWHSAQNVGRSNLGKHLIQSTKLSMYRMSSSNWSKTTMKWKKLMRMIWKTKVLVVMYAKILLLKISTWKVSITMLTKVV